MRKSLVLTALFLMFSFMGFSQEWHGITSDSPVKMKKTLVSSTEKEIVINVNLDGFYTQSVTTPNGKQVIVSAKDMAYELEAGNPQLSYDVIPVMIGDLAEMEVSVVNSTYVDYENIEVAPSKGNFSRQINPDDVPYTYGEMYQQDAFWPASQVALDAPYILRDLRGQNIWVRPFAYNPVTKTLRVYTSMTIAMTKVSDNGENQKSARKSATVKTSAEFRSAYERRFINFAEASKDYPWLEDSGEMLIICADQFMAGMQPLVDWKNQSGRPTTMVSVTAVGGNNDNTIKNYIANLYNDPNHNLVYVLFVGDYEHITPHSISAERSDNWFGQIEGTDHYPEVFIGRFSVQTDAHVATHVNKVLYYERDLQSNVTWADKGMGIGYYGAGSGHYGEDDYQHIDLIRDTLLHYTYSVVTEHHGGNGGDASTTTISNTINEGIGIINYCNHGSETSWGVANYSNSNVNALVNDNMLPIVWSVACLNGKFNYGSECFAEAWMRATNNSNGTPTGAIGGMFSWMSQPWVPPMYGQDEMVNILCEWVHVDQFNHTLAGTSLNGNMAVIDKAGAATGNIVHDTWILFGDPSLMVRTDNPTDMNLSLSPAALMIGMNTLEISADAAYGIATLSNADGVMATAKIVNGTATLEFPPLASVETLTLTVIGYNRVTEVVQIEVLPAAGAYISVDAFTPGNVPVVEEQHMSITFKNIGADPTTGTTNVVLSSEDTNITFTDNTGSFGVLAVNETVTLTDEFAFTVAAGVADNTKILVDVTATCGTDVWTGKAKITVGAPVIEFSAFQYSGSFEPGQTQTVVAKFNNNGHYQATNAVVTASSASQYVSFAETTFNVGTIAAGGEGVAIFNVTVDAACPTTEVLNLSFNLTADNGVEATGTGVMKNSCVVIFDLADSYGDGWNGNQLTVSFSDGTPQQNLTISNGPSATYTLEITTGVHVTLGWIKGNYTYECSFTVKYEDGTEITSASDPAQNYNFEFDVNCADEINTAAPVQNLAATVEGHDVTLTWAAPATGTPTGYIVKRDGILLEELGNVLTFVDAGLECDVTYTYLVIAKYADGESLPEMVTATIDCTSVDENAVVVGIYPNPAEDVLNVKANVSSFEYQLINNMGQVVVSGKANGETRINVSELNGVYFLKVIANGNAQIEKVVIK